MHTHHRDGRHGRWHMKMHRMGAHRRGRGEGLDRRSGRRPLGHGDLRLLILSLIAETPRHGYDLIQEIETRTGGAYKPSPGVMYPALEIIQDLGWAEARIEDGKKTFHLTANGQSELTREAETVAALHARLAQLSDAGGAAGGSDVRSAMHRLRRAVHAVAHGPSEDQAEDQTRQQQIVRILAAAADEIAALAPSGG